MPLQESKLYKSMEKAPTCASPSVFSSLPSPSPAVSFLAILSKFLCACTLLFFLSVHTKINILHNTVPTLLFFTQHSILAISPHHSYRFSVFSLTAAYSIVKGETLLISLASSDGHLGCFPSLAAANKAAVNNLGQSSFGMHARVSVG